MRFGLGKKCYKKSLKLLFSWTSVLMEMKMPESNFQSFLNFFFIGSLNGALYSLVVGFPIRHLSC